MADQQDLELLDDYLANRIHGAARSDFEQKLQADPDLQSEYALQATLVQGIRQARAAELKSMLNNVPVPSGGAARAFSSKAVLGTVTILIAAATWWFLSEKEMKKPPQKARIEQKTTKEQPVNTPPAPEVKKPKLEEKRVEKPAIETDKNQTSAGTEHSKPSLAKKPDPVLEPVEKNRSTPSPAAPKNNPAGERETKELRAIDPALAVNVDASNGRYSFHYRFADGNLSLYGPFETQPYRLIGTAEGKTVYLYYEGRYYTLKETDGEILPLTPLKDPDLLKTLDTYRTGQ